MVTVVPPSRGVLVGDGEGLGVRLFGGDDRDASAEDHRVALEDQLVDLTQQRAGQPHPGAGLLLESEGEGDGVFGHDVQQCKVDGWTS